MLLPRLGFRGTYNKLEFSEFEDENEGVVEGVDEDQESDDSDDNNAQHT